MSEEKLTAVQRELLKILSCSLNGKAYEPNPDIDTALLLKESRQQAVDLTVLDVLGKADSQTAGKFRERAFALLNTNLRIHSQHKEIHRLMTENNITYCILKGSASAYYYPDMALRMMGDVDFLVKKQDLERCYEVLRSKGFEQTEMEHICHAVFSKGNFHCEVHREPAGVPEGKAGEIILEYLDDIFDKSQLVKNDITEFVIPSHFHHGIIIFLHTYHHLLSEGVGLRHLCDIAVFFDKFTNEEFSEMFKEKLSKVGLWKFIQIMGAVSHKYLGIEYRAWMGNFDGEFLDAVILDIFEGGNFGVKDTNRYGQGVAISNRGKDGVKNSKIIQSIHSLNKQAYSQFHFLEKVKILKPFGWIFLVIRHFFRALTGKRHFINIPKALLKADKRKDIYKQFELFEVDGDENEH